MLVPGVSMGRAHELGSRGEDLAAGWLAREGWRIHARNWRFHHKEIDIIAERGEIVAFIEVKARSGDAYGHPLEAVTGRKRRELATAAGAWIARYGRRGQSYRFDAIWIMKRPDGWTVRHLEDAWRL